MKPRAKIKKGFTLVELLIVIAVVAILATVTLVAYNGVQQRTRDTARSEGVDKIKKALELYNIRHGQYPRATANPGTGGWELSTDVDGTFMEYLVDAGLLDRVPLDPINNSTHHYRYHRYNPGTYGCPVEKGGFYVLRVQAYESASNKPTDGQGVSCPSGSQTSSPSSTLYIYSSFEN